MNRVVALDGYCAASFSLLVACMLIGSGFGESNVSGQAQTPVQIVSLSASFPLSFEANQTGFVARGSGYQLSLSPAEIVISLAEKREGAAEHQDRPVSSFGGLAGLQPRWELPTEFRIKLIGANPNPVLIPLDELPGKVNYFVGRDPSQWRKEVPTYGKLKYELVYPGVDWVCYGNQQQLEYDFVIAPGADPDVITLSFEGVCKVELDEAGELVLQTERGEIRHPRPVIYQEVNGLRKLVAGGYRLLPRVPDQNREANGLGDRRIEDQTPWIGFQTGPYDTTRPLIIDPVLSYSSYVGGKQPEYASGIAVDSGGNAYVVGYTFSTDFPTANPIQSSKKSPDKDMDAFVAKLNADGTSFIYATYLGGSDSQIATGIAIDGQGNAYVTGYTGSRDFPTVNPLQTSWGGGDTDLFVAKLNPTGTALIYSTFLGGSSAEFGGGIAVDSSGNAYITGFTSSTNFPTRNAFQPLFGQGPGDPPPPDAFVAKLNAAGSSLVYSTYLGGNSVEFGTGITVDTAGQAYVSGTTASANFPAKNAFQPALKGQTDAYVAKLSSSGSELIYSTFLGGSKTQLGSGIAIDKGGNAYVTGLTLSDDFPVLNAVQSQFGGGDCPSNNEPGPCPDAFVTKLDPSGSALVYSTYLGGSSAENITAVAPFLTPFYGVAVDDAGNAYVTGTTSSRDFPTFNAIESVFGGGDCGAFPCPDAFIVKLNPAGSAFIYATFLGGNGAETISAIALDPSGSAYVTGISKSSSFRKASLSPGITTTRNDAFVVKISDAAAPVIPPPTTKAFSRFGFDSKGHFELEIRTEPGKAYGLEMSDDLRNWLPVLGFQEKDGSFQFVDFQAPGNRQRFYRLTLIP